MGFSGIIVSGFCYPYCMFYGMNICVLLVFVLSLKLKY